MKNWQLWGTGASVRQIQLSESVSQALKDSIHWYFLNSYRTYIFRCYGYLMLTNYFAFKNICLQSKCLKACEKVPFSSLFPLIRLETELWTENWIYSNLRDPMLLWRHFNGEKLIILHLCFFLLLCLRPSFSLSCYLIPCFWSAQD